MSQESKINLFSLILEIDTAWFAGFFVA